MGERPMLSPHVQSNAQIYNYHQTTHQGSNRLTPSQQQQQQQQHVPTMGYYNNNNGHAPAPPAVNGCMNAELDHRQSLERLAAISHPSEQFTHNQEVGSPAHSTNKVSPSQFYQPPVTVAGNMTAPVSACQHRTDLTNSSRPPFPAVDKNLTAETVASPSVSNQPLQSKPTTVSSSGEHRTMSNALPTEATVKLAPDRTEPVSATVTKEHESAEDDMKPKETAVDSGIDSEQQVDKDNDEEHDTSTTSNKSEASPQPSKMALDTNLLATKDTQVHDSSEPHSNSDMSKMDSGDQSILSPAETGYQSIISPIENISQSNLSLTENKYQSMSPKEKQSPASTETQNVQPKDSKSVDATPVATGDRIVNSEESVRPDSIDHGTKSEETYDTETMDTSQQQSELNESFSSQISNSFSSSGASKQSMGDESRLPPRKRKQQLSEHTKSLKAAMPIKKRGRPSKEAVRMREAARLAEYQRAAELTVQKETSSTLGPLPVKERKSSISSMSKVKKPVHSGTLLHSPKLNLAAKEEPSKVEPVTSQHTEMVDNDVIKVSVINKPNSLLPLKSNAVLVSPPRKPKANVNEMEKALMSMVGTDVTGETHFNGRRPRGRPPGSKNRRTKMGEQRGRSNSASSVSKSQYNINLAVSSPKEGTSQNSESTPSEATSTNSTTPAIQSHKLSLSVQNRAKSLQYRKQKGVSPKSLTGTLELKLPISSDQWVCTFCQHISNYRDMGDLFGGYNIQPHTPLPAKMTSHRKTSDLRQLPPDKNNRPNEIWFHERCIIWSPGVYMHAGNLYGVYEAITAAFQTVSTF